jgi:large subunit ribosomal protein L17
MKHRAKGRKLGRKRDQRKALLKSLMNSLVKYGKIETTEAKAKEIRPRIEKLVTKAKAGNLANRRLLMRYLQKDAVKKLMEETASRYKDRRGGYTRIIKLHPKQKDKSPTAMIEFV